VTFPNVTGGSRTLSSTSGAATTPSGPCTHCASVKTGKVHLRIRHAGRRLAVRVTLPAGVSGRVKVTARPNRGHVHARWIHVTSPRVVHFRVNRAATKVTVAAVYPGQNYTAPGRARKTVRL
jgi:hypothetical protein